MVKNKKVQLKMFKKAVKDVLFSKPKHHGEDKNPNHQEVNLKFKLERKQK